MAEKEKIKELLESSSENNYVKANQIFNELISLKVKEVLDVGKSIMADEIYNIVEGPPPKNKNKNSEEEGGLLKWAKEKLAGIGDKRSDEEKKKALEDKKKKYRSKQGKQDQNIPNTKKPKEDEASRVPAHGETAPRVSPKTKTNVRKPGEELVPSKGPGRQDKEGSSSAQPKEPKKQPTKKIKPKTALEKVREKEKEKRDAKRAAQEKQKDTVYDDDPTSGTAARAAQREQEKAIKKDNVAKKQGRTDREGSGSKQPQQQKSSGKRKPGEIYADAKKMLDKGDWEGPNKLVRGMSKEKRMQRALGTTKNQDERIAAAKAGATNQDFKSNLDRYRKELGQTKPKAKTWVNPDAPKKPGRTDPEGSGSAQPKEPKKPARKVKTTPKRDHHPPQPAPKPGLSPGAMGGRVKPVKKPRTTPNMAPQE